MKFLKSDSLRKQLHRYPCIQFSHGLSLFLANDLGKFPENLLVQILSLDSPDASVVEILKRSKRRSIFRISNFSPLIASLIVKGFPFDGIESRLKYKKYGLAEFINLQNAKRLGISVPDCYAYFEIRPAILVKSNGVLIEDLVGHSDFMAAMEKNPNNRTDILMSAIPILSSLYNKGINHIDPSPQNMMILPNGKGSMLVDWQYAAFLSPRQVAQLIMHASHFLKFAQAPSGAPETINWLKALYQECSPGIEFSRFARSVDMLRNHPKIDPSKRLVLELPSHILQEIYRK